MPTIGHAAIGFAAARAQARAGKLETKELLFYGALAVVPDLDLLPSVLHHPALVPLGHRGATHSLVAALLLAAALAPLAPGRLRLRTAVTCFLVVASHGLVDPLNSDSLGTAYFWPFSSARLTWGNFHPIPITPVGLDALHGAGLRNLCVEALIFSPFFAYAFHPRWSSVQRLWRFAAAAAKGMRGRPAVSAHRTGSLVIIVQPGKEPQKVATVMRCLRSLAPTAVLLVAPVAPGVRFEDAAVITVDVEGVGADPVSLASVLARA